jgi:uncharacterized protein (DUF697 family)/tellurite resistance protein
MTAEETRSILTIALMAAFADGLKDEGERAAVKRVAEALGPEAGFDLPGLYREVLLAKPDLAQVAASLQSQEARQLAYEMAVGVCDADGAQGSAEKAFLVRLAELLALPSAAAGATSARADEIAEAAFAPANAPASAGAAAATATATATVAGTVMGKSSLSDAEMDKLILNAAVTNAALELLPETIASMAIIPLQMRLVYRIGQAHGYAMDRTHAKDFLATLGVGLTSQYLEQFGRKLLGGVLGGLGGGLGRTVGRQAASSGLTFATTYALGQLAVRYYGGGRQMSTALLQQTYQDLLVSARKMQQQALPQIQQQARTLDAGKVLEMVRKPMA